MPPGWRFSADRKSIFVHYRMKDFAAGVGLILQIAEAAEKQDHHPDLHLTGYRHLKISLSTHSVGGLSKKDFTLAAKIHSFPRVLKT